MVEDGEKMQMKGIFKENHGGLSNEMDTVDKDKRWLGFEAGDRKNGVSWLEPGSLSSQAAKRFSESISSVGGARSWRGVTQQAFRLVCNHQVNSVRTLSNKQQGGVALHFQCWLSGFLCYKSSSAKPLYPVFCFVWGWCFFKVQHGTGRD